MPKYGMPKYESRILVRTAQAVFLMSVAVSAGHWSQPSLAKGDPTVILELAQTGSVFDPFDFALFNGPLPPFIEAVDTLIGTASNSASADILLAKLANLLAAFVRQNVVGQGVDCGSALLMLAALENRATSAMTASSINALSNSLMTGPACGEDVPLPDPEPEPVSEPEPEPDPCEEAHMLQEPWWNGVVTLETAPLAPNFGSGSAGFILVEC